MAKLTTEITIEELQYRIHAHENDLTQMWTADYFLSVQKELLALKQAAKNPIGSFHISGGQVEATTDYCRDGEWPVQDGEVLVYAAPVLPKQPEFYTKPDRFLPKSLKPEEISGERRNSRIAELMGWFDRYYSGKANPKWLKSHVAELCYYILTVPQLSAQPVSEPYKFPQGWIKGQFAYQDLFNAIGAAVVSKHPSIEISVKAFEDSMLAAAPAQESE